jgi:ATP-binding cassette, subfamily C (CFTR/MRP), member 1
MGCFSRIQQFLDKDAHVDGREKQPFFSDNMTKLREHLAESIESNDTTQEHGSTESLKTSYHPLNSDAVVIQDANFGWDTKKEPLLRNITFTLPFNKLTLLIGPVGSGKSTLLKAVLGEAPCLEGFVHIASESFAFCDQTPWHTNETIRNSILTTSTHDKNWYNTVIHACALDEDLHQLPRGDQTVIGSKGIALSMGQSQRVVCLAIFWLYV